MSSDGSVTMDKLRKVFGLLVGSGRRVATGILTAFAAQSYRWSLGLLNFLLQW